MYLPLSLLPLENLELLVHPGVSAAQNEIATKSPGRAAALQSVQQQHDAKTRTQLRTFRKQTEAA